MNQASRDFCGVQFHHEIHIWDLEFGGDIFVLCTSNFDQVDFSARSLELEDGHYGFASS